MQNDTIRQTVENMSILDKARQLTQINASMVATDKDATVTGNSGNLGLSQDDINGVGSVLNFSGAEKAIGMQTVHLHHNDIPLLLMQDVVHGYRTIYPHNIAMGGTFDPELVERCARMSAIEARANGVMVTFAPMVDLVRDARWGRVMESTGEDPYLNGIMGRAFIRGYHKGGLAVCVKHFAAYGAAEAGKDYNTTEVGAPALREYYLKGYAECMKENPEMVMSSFNLLNGIPVNGHTDLLVDLLRGEWKFDGVLISDYNGIGELINHGYCATQKECACVAANNEIDIEMMSSTYIHYLPQLVQEGKVPEEKVNRMVERVLRLKEKLGVFDKPFGGADVARSYAVLPEEHRALAREAAEKSCVLLKNDGALPLGEKETICVVGPYADEQSIIGNWKCLGKVEEAVSVKSGLERLRGTSVPVARACTAELNDADYSGVDSAVALARAYDTAIVCVGEHSKDAGEGASRSDLALPPVQTELVRRLHATGKKIVAVVFGGRPQVLTEIEPLCDAILYAWQPGTEGGTAIANLLYGVVAPSGKITVSFPRATGQCPIYYNHFNTGRPKIPDTPDNCLFVSAYRDCLNAPLYPFGYGLTYTRFEMSEITLSRDTMRRGESITASVTVRNAGDTFGEETVQLYMRDKFASVVRPVKELKGFAKAKLRPGEEKEISFTLDEDMLKFYTARGTFEAEAGDFVVMVGFDSRDVKTACFALQ